MQGTQPSCFATAPNHDSIPIAIQWGVHLLDEVKLEKELAENFRIQVQQAEARKTQWERFDHAAFVSWVGANRAALVKLAIDNGTVSDSVAAEAAVAGYEEDIRRLPELGPYDDLNAYLILKRLVSEIENACTALRLPTWSGVVFGTAPMLGLQAHQTSVQTTNASIIGVSPAFLPFCDFVSKALAVSLTTDPQKQTVSNDPEVFRAKMKARPDLILLWAKTLIHFAIYGLPPLKVDYKLDSLEGIARLEVLRAIELFAFGHEYGHHVLQHGTATPAGATDRLDQELEADFFGQGVAKYVGSTNGAPNFYAISGAGGVIILSALRIVRRIRGVLSTGSVEPEFDGSHPPLTDRIEAILATHGQDSESVREQCANMCDCFRQIFDALWEHLEPVCRNLHAQGTRPHDDVAASGGWLPLHS